MSRLPPPFPKGSEDPANFARCLAQAIEKGEYKLARRMLAQSATDLKKAGGNLDELRIDVRQLRTRTNEISAQTEYFNDRLNTQRADLKALTGRVADQEKLGQQIIESGQRLHGKVAGIENDVTALRTELNAFREEASKCAWGQHHAIARLNNIETLRGWDEEERAERRKTLRWVASNGACATAIGIVVFVIIQQLGWLPAISRLF